MHNSPCSGISNIFCVMFAWGLQRPEMRDVPSSEDFERKLLETDAYLQILIDQHKVIK